MAGHFYDDKGNPKHTVIGANGEERASHIGDARKHGWTSSVTTIIGVLAKPGLDFWKNNQLLDACLVNKPPVLSVSNEEYYDQKVKQWKGIVLEQANKITSESQKEGNRVHKLLETYFKGDALSKNSEIVPILDLLDETFGKQKWISEDSFSHPDGFAGQVDLHCKGIIVDFKTKIKENLDKTCMTSEYLMQIAAYRKGLDLPKAKCYNLFYSTTSKKIYLHESKEEDLVRGLKMFEALLSYYKLVNKL